MLSITTPHSNTFPTASTITCHVCGASIPRNAIALHLRRCIRESAGNLSSLKSRRALQHNTTLPCVNCHKHIAAHQFELHLRICSGPPAPLSSTPASQHITKYTRSDTNAHSPLPPISPKEEHPNSAKYTDVSTVSNGRYYPRSGPGSAETASTQLSDTSSEYSSIERIPCPLCGRKFVAESLVRHQSACSKLKNRPVFNAQAKRVKGTDLEKFVQVSHHHKAHTGASSAHDLGTPNPTTDKSAGPKKPGRMRTARSVDDYVTCPACDRKFNEDAAQRHIPVCEERKSRMDLTRKHQGKPAVSANGHTGDELLQRRLKYQPPLPLSKENRIALAAAKPKPPVNLSCGGCGVAYLTAQAKFCFECGTRRPG